ncbi:MAG TPA: glycosyltransferase family 2 protein [Armatimonadota bacterium]|nr:glycosyltransferase family 2 protein [Armatimonadota bacterium]
MIDLSIAIPSWNTSDLLDQCLTSIKASTAGLNYEIIVVDNASTDGSPEMVEEKHPDVMLIRNRVNLGFASACNAAFKRSTGRYFCLLNSDTIVLKDSLAHFFEFMESHPDAGAAGCKLLNGDGTLQRSCSCFPSVMTELFDALYLSKLFPRNRVFGCYSMSYWDFDDVREVDFVGGSCMMVRREAVEEVGLLDETYFMYTEEADWCYRMWDSGWKVYYYPGAQIIHLGGESAKRFGDDMRLYLYLSRNKFIRKYKGRMAAFVHRGIIITGALGRLAAYGIKRLIGRRELNDTAFQYLVLRWAVSGTSAREAGP